MENKSEKPIRNEIRDEELDAFFEENASEASKRPWDTEEWEEKREETIGDECEWCGGKEDLVIHHKEHEDMQWWKLWDRIRDYAFEKSDAYEELEIPTNECCPNCKSQSIYTRETKEPEYRCQKCKSEFDEPAEKEGSLKNSERYWKAMNEYVQRDDVREWITEQFGQIYEEYWESYFNMEYTATVCKSCHYAYHENNQKICSECGETYADYRGDLQKYVCWDCVVEIKELEKCPECGENWYNPEHRDECKKCRHNYSVETADFVCADCGEEWENQVVMEPPGIFHYHEADCEQGSIKQKGVTYYVCPDCDYESESEETVKLHVDNTNCSPEKIERKTYD